MTPSEVVTGRRALLSRRTTGGGLALTFAVVAVLIAGLTGCSSIGETVQQKTTSPENLANQRISAQRFISNWPNVEVIEFTREGSVDGSGEWSTNAVVTIDGREYEEIIGPWETAGDDLPKPPERLSPQPVTVKYSDGTSEVLE